MAKKKRIFGLPAGRLRAGFFTVASVAVLLAAVWYFRTHDVAVLSPGGEVATKQFHLIVFATLLSLVVILPVFIMTYVIVRNYRVHPDGKTRKPAAYTPDWDHNRTVETIWWGVPTLLIVILSVVIIKSSYALDPFQPLAASATTKPITVQVVAQQWKWLFIYPEQGIASVNYLEFPANTPIDFQITSDAPMNSFWIPKLGGQIYAMSGMSTQLHLIADQEGEYRGVSANLSGDGFAGMDFRVRATPQDEFDSWVQGIQHSNQPLTQTAYQQLAKPSMNVAPAFYTLPDKGLYDTVVMKYMAPGHPATAAYPDEPSSNTLPAMPHDMPNHTKGNY